MWRDFTQRSPQNLRLRFDCFLQVGAGGGGGPPAPASVALTYSSASVIVTSDRHHGPQAARYIQLFALCYVVLRKPVFSATFVVGGSKVEIAISINVQHKNSRAFK